MARSDAPAPDDPRFVLPRRRLGSFHTIETVLLASTACLLAAVAWPIATGQFGADKAPPASQAQPPADHAAPAAAPTAAPTVAEQPTIQLALLLDTSSSMDGLIDQARTRLWNITNALDSATFKGGRPRLEVAVYEYGNDGISAEAGHIRLVVGFTSELDAVSRALFALSTGGGSEHAPQAIKRASDELEWRSGEGVLRVLYVAGNESFQQGPVAWTTALDGASERGVVVNTVFCGHDQDSDAALWQAVAARGRGRHFTIDHDARASEVATPFDEKIGALGVAINGTYLGYGDHGLDGVQNQMEQDNNSSRSGSSVSRGLSKAAGNYVNPSWDLVDAVTEGVVDLEKVADAELPLALQGLDKLGRESFVASRRAERAAIKAELAELRTKREAFLATAVESPAPASLDVAMITAITEQAQRAGFTLDRR